VLLFMIDTRQMDTDSEIKVGIGSGNSGFPFFPAGMVIDTV